MRLRRELAQARAGKPSQASAPPAGGPPSPTASGAPFLAPCQVAAHETMQPWKQLDESWRTLWPLAEARGSHLLALCLYDNLYTILHIAAASSMPWSLVSGH